MTFFGDAYYCMRWKQSKIFSLNYLCTLISQQEVLFSLSFFFLSYQEKRISSDGTQYTPSLLFIVS